MVFLNTFSNAYPSVAISIFGALLLEIA